MMYPGHSLVPMLSMLLRRGEESLGTGCHVSFTIGVHRELKTYFHFVTMETGINFVGVYLISSIVCLFAC